MGFAEGLFWVGLGWGRAGLGLFSRGWGWFRVGLGLIFGCFFLKPNSGKGMEFNWFGMSFKFLALVWVESGGLLGERWVGLRIGLQLVWGGLG